jgi:hypothetical protein
VTAPGTTGIIGLTVGRHQVTRIFLKVAYTTGLLQ